MSKYETAQIITDCFGGKENDQGTDNITCIKSLNIVYTKLILVP